MFELVECPACRGAVPVFNGRVIKHGPAGAAPCSASGRAWSTIGAASPPAPFSLERAIGTAIGTALGVVVAEALGVRRKRRRKRRRRQLAE